MLLTIVFPYSLTAQSDTIKYSDSTVVSYEVVLASGRDIPPVWITTSIVHGEIMWFGKKHLLVATGVNASLLHSIGELYAESAFSVMRFSKYATSGPLTLRRKHTPETRNTYITTEYKAWFTNIIQATDVGIHIGLQRNIVMATPGQTLMHKPDETFATHLWETNELDIGLSVWTRTGIVVFTGKRCTSRFSIFRVTADLALYQIRKFSVSTWDSGAVTSEPKYYYYGNSDESGRWNFSDLPYKLFGPKVFIDYKGGRQFRSKNHKRMLGYHIKFGTQLLPETKENRLAWFAHFGFSFGLGNGMGREPGNVTPKPKTDNW